jgi:bis(5'-nucleosidyl)-tetraphosphatase
MMPYQNHKDQTPQDPNNSPKNPRKPFSGRRPEGPGRSVRKGFRRGRREVHEKSCGLIVYRRESEGLQFLLLHYPGGHWDFPKGHVEHGDQSEHDTARRELKEETGITQVELSTGYKESMYYEFNRGPFERVKKIVVYFLGETKENAVELSFEHQGCVWMPYDEALERLTYENAKDLLRKAQPYLEP